jgi:WD40 repeat protein
VLYFSQDADEPTTIQRPIATDPTKGNSNVPVVTIHEQEPLKQSRNPESSVKTCTMIGHSGPVTAMSINYNSTYLVSASTDSDIRLWDLTLGICIAVYKSHLKTVWTIDFCPLGTHFASGGSDHGIFIWSTQQPMPIYCLIGHNEEILQVKFTENRKYLGSISSDRTFRLWDLDDGSLKRIFVVGETPSCFALDANSEFVIIGTILGNVFVFNL